MPSLSCDTISSILSVGTYENTALFYVPYVLLELDENNSIASQKYKSFSEMQINLLQGELKTVHPSLECVLHLLM